MSEPAQEINLNELKQAATPRNLTKAATRFVVAGGVSMVMKDVIAHNTCTNEVFSTPRKRLMFHAARWALAGTVADKTTSWTDKKVDDVFDALGQVVQIIQVTKQS